MKRALPMYKMTPGLAAEGTVMVTDEALSVGEAKQRVKVAMECPGDSDPNIILVYSVPGHPVMRPDKGFVDLVSFFLSFVP